MVHERGYYLLVEFYTRVSNLTKQKLYQYIKNNNTTLLDYNFNNFFQYWIQEYKI